MHGECEFPQPAILPLVGKIMEKLIHAQMSIFLENTVFFSQYQPGFKKNHSTTSAAAKFVDDIILGLDQGGFTLAVFLDIKKAFHTIDHKIIIKKMEHAGIGLGALSLIKNHLCDRKQCVLYRGIKSDIKSLSACSTLGLQVSHKAQDWGHYYF